jgi:hypothetical protein
MASFSKGFSLLLTVILGVSSLIMVESGSAQTIPKPAVPQFSIQYADYSYDTQAYNSTDAFTGQQIQHPSQHIGDVRVEGKIKNQPFTRYNVSNPPNGAISSDIGLYYNVRYKGHFGTDWTEIYGYHNMDFISQNYSSEYTNFTIYWQVFPEGAQIDYQVKAMIGFEGWTYIDPIGKPVIIGEASEWSNTLTLIFTKNETAIAFASNIDAAPYPVLPTPSPSPSASLSPSPSPSPSPTVPEFPFITILTLLAAIPLITIFFVKKRLLKTFN